ncbi:carbonic anhydrase [Trichoderma afarasin]
MAKSHIPHQHSYSFYKHLYYNYSPKHPATMAPATWTELLEGNRVYAETQHKPAALLGQPGFEIPSVMIFTCIDFRASAEAFLGMKGDEAFVVRNPGGRITTGIQSLLFVDTLTGGQALKDIVIIHHFDCGCTHITDDVIKDALKAKSPELGAEIDKMAFGTYSAKNVQQHINNIETDIKFLKDSPLVREELKERVHAYIFDLQSGKLVAVPINN